MTVCGRRSVAGVAAAVVAADTPSGPACSREDCRKQDQHAKLSSTWASYEPVRRHNRFPTLEFATEVRRRACHVVDTPGLSVQANGCRQPELDAGILELL